MKKRVLILEDEKVIGKIYKKKLELAGFEVLWAETIHQFESLRKGEQLDVFLLDHGIRGQHQSGIDLIPEIKRDHPGAKVLVVSNYSSATFRDQALQQGADDYFVKINTSPKALVQYIQGLFLES